MSDLRVEPGKTQGIRSVKHKNEKHDGKDFKELIAGAIDRVNDAKLEADQNIEHMARGKTGIHETMISMQKADLSLRLLLQVRNKAMDAYREIMRMPF